MDDEKKSKSRKISSLLPSDLCEDLCFNEDSNADEFSEVKSPIYNGRKLKSKYGRRRSSSFDFNLSLLAIKPLDHKDFHINPNTKFIKNLEQSNSNHKSNEKNKSNLNNQNIQIFNNEQKTHSILKYPNNDKIINNNIINNNNNIINNNKILCNNNNIINNNNNIINNNIINIHPIQNIENYEIIHPRKKTSDNCLHVKTVKFNVNNNNNNNNTNNNNNNNNINNNDYFISTVNGISIQKIPKIPVKKYSSKNNSQREFIDPDLLNTNQTFKEFLNNTGNKLSSIMKASIGSRFLQKMLDKIDEDDIDEIFFRIGKDITDLMCDNYGNYFLQQLILKCNLKQRLYLYDKLKKNFIEVAKDMGGTHCIQSLIEPINSSKEENLLRELIQNNLLELSYNSNSTHIIQKIICTINENNRQYINIFIFENIVKLCKDVNGISIIKKFISENNSINIRNEIIKLLIENCLEITQDQYGNYAIQHAIEKFGYVNCYNLIRIIYKNVVFLSCQKFSSNVIDKIVLISYQCNYNDFRILIEIMFLNIQNFNKMSQNKFGMFVLQNSAKLMNINEKVVIRNFLNNKIMIEMYDDKIQLQKLIQLLSI